MSRNNIPQGWGSEEHPPLEMLRHYQSGDLPAPESHQVERHLLTCELCSDLVDGMSLARPARVQNAVRETRGRLKNLLIQKKRKRKVFQWPVWQTTAVLLVLVFAIAEVIYHHYFALPKNHFPTKIQQAPPAWQFSGRVQDPAGMPLAGALVQVKETGTKTTTAPNGQFTLQVAPSNATVVITLNSYHTKTLTVTQQTPLTPITLEKTE